MFYVEDQLPENTIIRIFPTEGKITDKEVNIGVISIDGKEVKYVSLVSKNIRTIDCIRSGNYKMPEPIKKNGATGNVSAANNNSGNDFMSIPKGSEEEIPF